METLAYLAFAVLRDQLIFKFAGLVKKLLKPLQHLDLMEDKSTENFKRERNITSDTFGRSRNSCIAVCKC